MIYSTKIESGKVFLNEEKLVIEFKGENDWKKELYQALELEYPKFYKMDALSKMATLALEVLKRKVDLTQFDDDGLSLIFANSSSSSATDNKFISSYSENGSPSPSLFVYTLPNIITGELCIRNKWYGENTFFINEKFTPELYLEQINFNFSKWVQACLCGWVEASGSQEECTLFLIMNDGRKINKIDLINIYSQ